MTVIIRDCSESLPITIFQWKVTFPTLAYPFLVTCFSVPAQRQGSDSGLTCFIPLDSQVCSAKGILFKLVSKTAYLVPYFQKQEYSCPLNHVPAGCEAGGFQEPSSPSCSGASLQEKRRKPSRYNIKLWFCSEKLELSNSHAVTLQHDYIMQ